MENDSLHVCVYSQVLPASQRSLFSDRSLFSELLWVSRPPESCRLLGTNHMLFTLFICCFNLYMLMRREFMKSEILYIYFFKYQR